MSIRCPVCGTGQGFPLSPGSVNGGIAEAATDASVNAATRPSAMLSLAGEASQVGEEGLAGPLGLAKVGIDFRLSLEQRLWHAGRGQLMHELSSESPRVFKAGRFRNSNVFAAALAGALGGVLMIVVMGLVVSGNPTRNNILFASGLALVLVLSALCFVPGNLIAAYPYAVSIEEGRGLELRAVLKKLYIPLEEVRDVQKSYLQPGYVVRLKRRHRLLKSFLISLVLWGRSRASR